MERYLARGEVTGQQYRDGERLLRDWLLSGLEPQITGAYDAAFLGAALPPVPGTRARLDVLRRRHARRRDHPLAGAGPCRAARLPGELLGRGDPPAAHGWDCGATARAGRSGRALSEAALS